MGKQNSLAFPHFSLFLFSGKTPSAGDYSELAPHNAIL